MNNQPAFPVANPFLVKPPLDEADALRLQNGMTLLDYFAAEAMKPYLRHSGDLSREHVASGAYLMAEAMMAERTKRGL